ncbi:hypothetical protein E1A91_A11G192500v1 [Gossypium mustelinum]|nr:hypothetical protein E1A91_A11G192500v1 [Gossypium mustelinum]
MSELKQHGGKGMSDLLSPILFVMEDESKSFWCFVALMERLGPNFNRDQNAGGVARQKQNDCLNYFFCSAGF